MRAGTVQVKTVVKCFVRIEAFCHNNEISLKILGFSTFYLLLTKKYVSHTKIVLFPDTHK